MTSTWLKRRFVSRFCGLAAVVGGAVVGASAAAWAADTSASTSDVPRSAEAPADTLVVKRLHAINQMEISTGKVAASKGDAQAVRDFGAMLVRDHQAADQTLLAYAKKASIDPNAMPTKLAHKMAAERAHMDQICTLTGQAFDREFIRAMRDGHATTISLVESARPAVDDPDLRTLLGGLLPMLKEHYEIAASLAAPSTAATPSDQTPKPASTGQEQPPRSP